MVTQKKIRERPMKGVELLEETAWLLSMGVHPETIAEQLAVKTWSIPRLAYRYRLKGDLNPEQREAVDKVLVGYKGYDKALPKRMTIDTARRYDEHFGIAGSGDGGQRFLEGTR